MENLGLLPYNKFLGTCMLLIARLSGVVEISNNMSNTVDAN